MNENTTTQDLTTTAGNGYVNLGQGTPFLQTARLHAGGLRYIVAERRDGASLFTVALESREDAIQALTAALRNGADSVEVYVRLESGNYGHQNDKARRMVAAATAQAEKETAELAARRRDRELRLVAGAPLAPAEDVVFSDKYDYRSDVPVSYWEKEAENCERRRQESWERSDNDGFLSQWANQEMAARYRRAASIARNGYVEHFRVVADLDGNVLSDDERKGDYGYYWLIRSAQGKERFFKESTAVKKETALRNNARKGRVMVRASAPVEINYDADTRMVEGAEYTLDTKALETIQAARKLAGLEG